MIQAKHEKEINYDLDNHFNFWWLHIFLTENYKTQLNQNLQNVIEQNN